MKLKVKKQDKSEVTIHQPTVLKRIISGGQIGADIAGLKAAKHLGFRTGGHMPEGYLTLSGGKVGYSWKYRLIDDCPDYRTRTWKNVFEADATIRLATNFFTPGERCTLNAIHAYKKLSLDVFMEEEWSPNPKLPPEKRLEPREVAYWIVSNGIETLNIAGNANVALEIPVYFYLLDVFNIILKGEI